MTRLDHMPPFLKPLLAYCMSEAAAKGSRLLVVVSVARSMEVEAIGLAAAALAASDIVKSLSENGVGQRIISAPQEALDATCKTAHRIFWLWCGSLFALQLLIGAAIWAVTGDLLIWALIAILAGEYLFMPAGLVQAALAMRAGKMQQTAAIAGGQVVASNIMAALLATAIASPLALVLPRLLSAPIWLIAMRRLHPWSHRALRAGLRPAPLRPFLRYGAAVLGVEVVKALRLQADKLVIGVLMGAEVLGLYFMAFNAGLGLATSFSNAFATALFPHLCTARDRAAALRQALFLSVGIITPLVVLQALAAPYYVPVLFGAGWDGIAEIVSLLCLAAIPGVIWSGAAQWLRSHDRPQTELRATVLMTVALIGTTALLTPYGLKAIAIGYLCVATATQLLSALPALAPAFRAPLEKAI